MYVIHLDQAEMEKFRNRRPDDPSVLKDEWLKQHAERAGGITLEFWKLVQGRVWDIPVMMSADEAAKRLSLPDSEGRRLADEAADAHQVYLRDRGSLA